MNIYYKYPFGDKYSFIHNPLWYYRRYIWYPLHWLKIDLRDMFFPRRPIYFTTEDGDVMFIPVSETNQMDAKAIVRHMLNLTQMEMSDLAATEEELISRLKKKVSTITFNDNMILPTYKKRIECWVLEF